MKEKSQKATDLQGQIDEVKARIASMTTQNSQLGEELKSLTKMSKESTQSSLVCLEFHSKIF